MKKLLIMFIALIMLATVFVQISFAGEIPDDFVSKNYNSMSVVKIEGANSIRYYYAKKQSDGKSYVFAYDYKNKKTTWSQQIKGVNSEQLPFILKDNVIYVVSNGENYESYMYAISTSGKLLWEVRNDKPTGYYSNLFFSPNNDVMYLMQVSSSSVVRTGNDKYDRILAFDTQTGKLKWTYAVPFFSGMSYDFETTQSGQIFFRNSILKSIYSNGSEAWMFNGIVSQMNMDSNENIIVVPKDALSIQKLNHKTGNADWTFTGNNIYLWDVIDNTVFVDDGFASQSNLTYLAIDVNNGKVKWKFTSKSRLYFEKVNGNGSISYSDEVGKFHLLTFDKSGNLLLDGKNIGKVENGVVIEPSTLLFTDIKSGFWAEKAIYSLAKLKIVAGFPDGTFRPQQKVTREEFVTMLVNAQKLPLTTSKHTQFRDVPGSRWSHSYIETAIDYGLIIASDYGVNFAPSKAITRLEMAVMAARALDLHQDETAIQKFIDQDVITKYKGLVGATVNAGIISGYPDQTFQPQNALTRAEASSVILRVVEYNK